MLHRLNKNKRRQKSTSYFPYIMYTTKKIQTYRDIQYGENTASGCTILEK